MYVFVYVSRFIIIHLNIDIKTVQGGRGRRRRRLGRGGSRLQWKT
jgi:hypothetical protein